MIILKSIIKSFVSNPLWIYNMFNLKYKKKKLILIGTPVHGNLGDHLIAQEEKNFLQDYFKEYYYYECVMPEYIVANRLLKYVINSDDLILISGGGWLGNLWMDNEVTFRHIINSFPNNRIILFPQTAYYTHDQEGRETLRKTADTINKHGNLLLMFRDLRSYETMRKVIDTSNIRIKYYPDMALYGSVFESKNIIENVSDRVLVCLRKDREADIDREEIIKDLSHLELQTKEFTTVKDYRVYPRDRIEELKKLQREILNSKLILTDRLHAMIFAVVNSIPCIAFDNKTKKVSGVSKWLYKTKLIKIVSNKDDAINSIISMKLIDNISFSRKYLKCYFDDMANDIRKDMK